MSKAGKPRKGSGKGNQGDAEGEIARSQKWSAKKEKENGESSGKLSLFSNNEESSGKAEQQLSRKANPRGQALNTSEGPAYSKWQMLRCYADLTSARLAKEHKESSDSQRPVGFDLTLSLTEREEDDSLDARATPYARKARAGISREAKAALKKSGSSISTDDAFKKSVSSTSLDDAFKKSVSRQTTNLDSADDEDSADDDDSAPVEVPEIPCKRISLSGELLAKSANATPFYPAMSAETANAAPFYPAAIQAAAAAQATWRHETSLAMYGNWLASMDSASQMAPGAARASLYTTVMLRNIPNRYTRDMLVEKLSATNGACIDFLYLPIDFTSKCNVGYAFINFREAAFAKDFTSEFHGKQSQEVLPGFGSSKTCEVSYARVQGLEANMENLRDEKFIEKLREKSEWQPLFYDEEGKGIPFAKVFGGAPQHLRKQNKVAVTKERPDASHILSSFCKEKGPRRQARTPTLAYHYAPMGYPYPPMGTVGYSMSPWGQIYPQIARGLGPRRSHW